MIGEGVLDQVGEETVALDLEIDRDVELITAGPEGVRVLHDVRTRPSLSGGSSVHGRADHELPTVEVKDLHRCLARLQVTAAVRLRTLPRINGGTRE